jgi:hypothetical protein
MSETHKTPRDPKCHPAQRKITWAAGSATLLETLPGTGGFLLLRKDKDSVAEFTVQVFINVDLGSFKWEKPADEDWRLIDVPKGFSINNGDALVGAFGAALEGTIVHGRP